MPELPEVETVRIDLERRLLGKTIGKMKVRRKDLREPIKTNVAGKVNGKKVLSITRRAKYILIGFADGNMVIHLGMSGTVRADPKESSPIKHDHVEWHTDNSTFRYNDPRRFGRIFWTDDPTTHHLLAKAGIEPLERGFSAKALHGFCKNRKIPIKQLIMDGSIIAGIGNIYASESLFFAKVLPTRPSSSISPSEAGAIARNVKKVLRRAIKAGGSTLRNHAGVDGKPGYFQLNHKVYGKEGMPCEDCSAPIMRIVLGQRATFYCGCCQK